MDPRNPEMNGFSNSDDLETKEVLQRRLEGKREEIAHKVDEIRSTLSQEVRERKAAMKQAVDWKYYVKKNPIVCVGGALAAGIFLGKALGTKASDYYYEEEPTWKSRASDYLHSAESKVNRLRGKAEHEESRWKERSRKAFSSTSDIVLRELMKTAQNMIIPTVVAAVTGKLASDNKTTVVEKNVVKTPPGMPDHESTTSVKKFDSNGDPLEA